MIEPTERAAAAARTLLLARATRIGWLSVSLDVARLRLALRQFNPAQPRVPAGSPTGGQWVGNNAPREMQGRRRGPVELTPGLQAQLLAARIGANAAVARVQRLDPTWRPTPSLTSGSAQGDLAALQARRAEAESYLSTLARNGIGDLRFVVESFPARGPGRMTATETRANNANFRGMAAALAGPERQELQPTMRLGIISPLPVLIGEMSLRLLFPNV